MFAEIRKKLLLFCEVNREFRPFPKVYQYKLKIEIGENEKLDPFQIKEKAGTLEKRRGH